MLPFVILLLIPPPASTNFDHTKYTANLALRTCNPDDTSTHPSSQLLSDFEPCSPYGLCFNHDCHDKCADGTLPLGAVCGFFGICEVRLGDPICANSCENDPNIDPGWESDGILPLINKPCGAIGDCVSTECKDHCSGEDVGAPCGFFGICSQSGECSTNCLDDPVYTPNHWLNNAYPVCSRSETGDQVYSRRGVCVEEKCRDPCRLEGFSVSKLIFLKPATKMFPAQRRLWHDRTMFRKFMRRSLRGKEQQRPISR